MVAWVFNLLGKPIPYYANYSILLSGKDGIIIHRGAIVGAGSVVVDTVPENGVVIGVPAKIIKYHT